MKKRFLCVLLALVILLSLASCGGEDISVELVRETAWAEYDIDDAPVKIIEAGGVWYALMGKYAGGDFRLAVGTSYENFDNIVYEAQNVSIWFFEANEKYAVWGEKNGSVCEFKLYTRATGAVSSIRTLGGEGGYQNANVGLYGESVYFLETDYSAGTSAIMRYDAAAGELSRFYEFGYAGERSSMNLSLAGGTLLAVGNVGGKTSLVRFELAKGGAPTVRALRESVDYVYDAAYDTVTGACAIYYLDKSGAEHIGVMSEKSNAIDNIMTFEENVYAYEDTVCMHAGRVYWITQINASGVVSEHYSFMDYDYKQGTRTEYLRTFGFSVADDGVYLLSYNKVDYDGVFLTKILLGGKKQ